MSQLILPSYLTPAAARLREHFEQKGRPTGTIADFKVQVRWDFTPLLVRWL